MTASSMLLTGCAVLDAVHETVSDPTTVRIEDGRITEIGGSGASPDLPTVDLEGRFVAPGLWDVHCHLSLMIPDPSCHSRFDSVAEATLRAGHNAIDALHVGFTGLRVVGEVDGIDFAWRNAFRSGMYDGPRLFCAGHLLSTTGGHLRQSRLAPLRLEQLTTEFDGAAEALRAVRHQIHLGADVIKLAITGGMGLHEAIDERQMTSEELAAAITAAHNKGRRVAAHASGGDATKDALRIGIESVEHGYVLDEECIELMAGRDTTYVPTIGVTHDPAFADRHEWPEAIKAKAAVGAPAHRDALRMAIERGLRICTGGDKYPIVDSGRREIELVAELGLGNAGALRAATINAAQLCGVDADLGTVEPGKIADLVVLDANPLDDITAIRQLALVVKGGRVVVDHLSEHHAERAIGAGVSALGVPLPPRPPEPAPRLCC
jgi:imidazolonepropionase-like amidohydrolase